MINSKKKRRVRNKQQQTSVEFFKEKKTRKTKKIISFCLCSFPVANGKSLGGETEWGMRILRMLPGFIFCFCVLTINNTETAGTIKNWI